MPTKFPSICFPGNEALAALTGTPFAAQLRKDPASLTVKFDVTLGWQVENAAAGLVYYVPQAVALAVVEYAAACEEILHAFDE